MAAFQKGTYHDKALIFHNYKHPDLDIFQAWCDVVGNVILKEVEEWFTENKVGDQTKADNGQRPSSTGQK